MRMLATMRAPTDVRLRLLGHDLDDVERRVEVRRQLGCVPQKPGFHRHFTVFEFVDYAGRAGFGAGTVLALVLPRPFEDARRVGPALA
jgi:ABC-type multidrug transport system ATPase subunit